MLLLIELGIDFEIIKENVGYITDVPSIKSHICPSTLVSVH